MSGSYVPRLSDELITELFAEFSALLLVGPRASGKTTTAMRHARSVIRLDDPREAAVVEADPDAALRDRAEPVLIDEWQVVPSVLGAVKRAVDTLPRSGRFIVTGSVRGRLDSPTWPGTGRLIQIDMGTLTMREIIGDDLHRLPFLLRIASDGAAGLRVPAEVPDLRGRGYSSDRTSPGQWFAMVEPLGGGPCSAETPVVQAAWVASSSAEG